MHLLSTSNLYSGCLQLLLYLDCCCHGSPLIDKEVYEPLICQTQAAAVVVPCLDKCIVTRLLVGAARCYMALCI